MTFRIVPGKPVIKKVVNSGKNGVKITWKKQKNVSGYEIFRAESKNGEYHYLGMNKKDTNTSYTDKALKKGKTYYYKVRSYKMIKGVKVSGDFSKVKAVKR